MLESRQHISGHFGDESFQPVTCVCAENQSRKARDKTRKNSKYKLLCPRGTQTCALAVANIKVNGNGKVILDTHPESDQHQN